MQHVWNRVGLETSVFFMILNELRETLPADMPVLPLPTVVGLLAPKLKL